MYIYCQHPEQAINIQAVAVLRVCVPLNVCNYAPCLLYFLQFWQLSLIGMDELICFALSMRKAFPRARGSLDTILLIGL